MSESLTKDAKQKILDEDEASRQRAMNEGIPGYSKHPEWREMTPDQIADEVAEQGTKPSSPNDH